MHYYQFNIGDYSGHTSRLSPMEDLAYRRLLDLYYLNERPFNGCSTNVARDIGLVEFQDEVDYILLKFFPKDGDDWINKRAQNEINSFKGKKKQQSDAGKASAEARKINALEKESIDRPTDVQRDSNGRSTKHKPLNNNHYKDKPSSSNKLKFDSDDMKMAQLIFESIRRLNPDNKRPNFESWANHVRLMRDRDKRTHKQIAEVFVWANKDHFWQNTILSPKKLREQFDQLLLKMNQEREHGTRQPNNPTRQERVRAKIIGDFVDSSARANN